MSFVILGHFAMSGLQHSLKMTNDKKDMFETIQLSPTPVRNEGYCFGDEDDRLAVSFLLYHKTDTYVFEILIYIVRETEI